MKAKIAAVILCFCFIVLAFSDVPGFIDASRRGLVLFAVNVLPVLFPFFFITSLLVELDFFVPASKPFSGVMRKVYKTSGASAAVAVLSLIGGYPTGARMLSELYVRGQISRNDAIKTSTFTSTCSPVFIIATAGAIFLKSTALGVLIFAAHVLAALLNGLIYRNVRFRDIRDTQPLRNVTVQKKGISDVVSAALASSIQNIFAVGGLIVLFFVAAYPFGTAAAAVLEMTNGVHQTIQDLTAANLLGGALAAVVPCAVLSFGGLCVAVQGFVFMGAFKMPFRFYLLYKTTHMLLASGLCWLGFTVFF